MTLPSNSGRALKCPTLVVCVWESTHFTWVFIAFLPYSVLFSAPLGVNPCKSCSAGIIVSFSPNAIHWHADRAKSGTEIRTNNKKTTISYSPSRRRLTYSIFREMTPLSTLFAALCGQLKKLSETISMSGKWSKEKTLWLFWLTGKWTTQR